MPTTGPAEGALARESEIAVSATVTVSSGVDVRADQSAGHCNVDLGAEHLQTAGLPFAWSAVLSGWAVARCLVRVRLLLSLRVGVPDWVSAFAQIIYSKNADALVAIKARGAGSKGLVRPKYSVVESHSSQASLACMANSMMLF